MIMEEMKTAVRQLVQAMPQQQDNAVGQAAYVAQLVQWNAKWGESA
jgi:predicted S18 family serine protease